MLADLKHIALLAAYAGAIAAYALFAAGVIVRAANRQGVAISAMDAAYLAGASSLLLWAMR